MNTFTKYSSTVLFLFFPFSAQISILNIDPAHHCVSTPSRLGCSRAKTKRNPTESIVIHKQKVKSNGLKIDPVSLRSSKGALKVFLEIKFGGNYSQIGESPVGFRW